MKVTQVGIKPSEATVAAGRISLEPELLAAVGARYSRNNEGLEAILELVDHEKPGASVDRIFNLFSYGHQSVAGLAPVAIFMDGISIFMAYYVFSLCSQGDGQESSTRYIKMSIDGLVDPDILGIPKEEQSDWKESMTQAFQAYENAVAYWTRVATDNPEVMNLPASLLADDSDKSKKIVERMKRNYVFDRSRYFIPVAASTNMMLVQSARSWVQLVTQLLSCHHVEAHFLGLTISDELDLVVPRLTKHATKKDSYVNGLQQEFEDTRMLAQDFIYSSEAYLEVNLPALETHSLAGDLAYHDNRYAYIGKTLQRTSVRFGWNDVAFAEIRDMNRHRTGTKYCPLAPTGFYCAMEQMLTGGFEKEIYPLCDAEKLGTEATNKARQMLIDGKIEYIYHCLLGSTFPFEQTTTADKFIYTEELRTGLGTHFRYRKHYLDVLSLWFQRFPTTKGLILEGSGEPE